MSQQSLFIADGVGGNNVAAVDTAPPGVSEAGLVTRNIDPAEGATGSAIPATAILIGASDGTNLQQLLVESASSRNLRVGLYNGTNEASITTTGSAAGNALQTLIGQFNTSLPTLTTGQTSFVQLDSNGRTIVVGAAANGSAVAGNPVRIAGSDGANTRDIMTDTLGIQVTADASYAASTARISGGLADHRFGFSAGTSRPQALRATTYTEPTTAAQRSVSSSNANDTSTGTGAQKITITYFDNSMNGPNTEVVTLNGTTPVNTVATNIRFIERMEVTSVGSGGANAGTITLFASAGGAGGTVGSIGFANRAAGVGDNQTFWAHHYVRAGKTMYLLGISAAMAGSTAGMTYGKYLNPTVSTSAEVVRTPMLGTRHAMTSYQFKAPVQIPGPARFTLYNSDTGGNECDGSFEYMEY